MGHGPGEGAGEVLDAEGVRVAGRLEGRALVAAPGRATGDRTGAHVRVEAGEDLVEIGVDAGDRRTGEGPGEVAVLAVRRAALGEVETPVGRRRDRLEPAGGRGGGRDGGGGFWQGGGPPPRPPRGG